MSTVRSENRKRQNTCGESMVVAVVLMLVFFVLGLTVLTGASAASAGVNGRVKYRQAYYYARSVFDVVDEGLVKGDLGTKILTHETGKIEDLTTGAHKLPAESFDLTLACDTLPPDFKLSEASFSYEPTINKTNGTTATITLRNAALTLRVGYLDQSYYIKVVYRYDGQASKGGVAWNISNGAWELRSIS